MVLPDDGFRGSAVRSGKATWRLQQAFPGALAQPRLRLAQAATRYASHTVYEFGNSNSGPKVHEQMDVIVFDPAKRRLKTVIPTIKDTAYR
jgi:hypothetical protein